MTDLWLILTNVGIIVVTGGAIWASLREEHRHSEHVIDVDEKRDEHLIELALEAVEAKRERDHDDAH